MTTNYFDNDDSIIIDATFRMLEHEKKIAADG